MNIEFIPLKTEHLPLLQSWLNSPHVQEHWDQGTTWTKELVWEKYGSYTEGYKLLNNLKYPIQASIILFEAHPIGYIQSYDAFVFPRDGYDLQEALKDTAFANSKLAAFDIFLGEKDAFGKGIGTAAIRQYLANNIWPNFEACLVDPDATNPRAIRAYEKAGFVRVKELTSPSILIMCAQCS